MRFGTYSQLPDYDEFRGYDMGIDVVLSQIAQKMYGNIRVPYWGTSKRHLSMVEIRKNCFAGTEIIAEMAKRAISNKKECLGRFLKSLFLALLMNW